MDRQEDRWYQNCLSVRIAEQPTVISFLNQKYYI